MTDFNTIINSINSRQDFIDFVELLLSDLKANPKEWTNDNLQDYLSGISSWTEDMDGYFENFNLKMPENIDWKIFAKILMAAKFYE